MKRADLPIEPLVKDEKYRGRWVALKSPVDNTVVGSGKTPGRALKQAHDAGVKEPVLLFVPLSRVGQNRPVRVASN
jgi:hypothetical protein